MSSDRYAPILHDLAEKIDAAIRANNGMAPDTFEVSQDDYMDYLRAIPANERFCKAALAEKGIENIVWRGVPVVIAG